LDAQNEEAKQKSENKQRSSPLALKKNPWLPTLSLTLALKIEADLRGQVASPLLLSRSQHIWNWICPPAFRKWMHAGWIAARRDCPNLRARTCSGARSFLLSDLASRTKDGEVCALVDARDSFDSLTANCGRD